MKHHLIVLLLAVMPVTIHAQADKPELWKGRFRVENPGPGYKVTPDTTAMTNGTNLFDLIAVLPGVTVEDGNFSINGSPAAGIYINDVRIYEIYGLKYISASGVSHINVTYAPNGDNSATSDGGKIKIYLDNSSPASGILSAGTSFRPSDGFSNAMVFSSADLKGKKHTVSNIIHYTEGRSATGTGTPQTTSRTIGPERSINEKLSAQYSLTPSSSVAGSFTLMHESSGLSTTTSFPSVSDDSRKYWKYGAELIYNLSIPKVAEVSASISGAFITEDRENGYSDLSRQYGDHIRVNTSDIEASITAVMPVNEKTKVIAGTVLDAVNSEYTLLSSYGNPPFDNSIEAAWTKGYTSRIYALVTGSAGILRYNAGLNLQSHTISYKDGTTGKYAKNSKTGINPTLKLFMPLCDEPVHTMTLVYRRSNGEIPYRAITPYMYWSDETSYTTGNPSLKPPVSDYILLGFSMYSSALNIGISYRRDDGQIEYAEMTDPDNPAVTFVKPVNMETTHTASLNIGVTLTKKMFKSRIFLRGDLLKEPHALAGTAYGALRTRAYLSANNSISLGKGYIIEINGRWQPSWIFCDKTYSDVYAVYGSAGRNFLDDTLHVSLDFTPWAGGGSYKTANATYKSLEDKRYVGVSLSWRF